MPRGDACQYRRGAGHFPDRQISSGVGIKYGQSQRAKELTQVGHVRNQGVADCAPRKEGGRERQVFALVQKVSSAKNGRQQQERDLLHDQTGGKGKRPG